MFEQTLKGALLALILVGSSQALPGLRAPPAEDCLQLSGSYQPSSCVETSSTTLTADATLSADRGAYSVTPGPVLIAQAYRRGVNDMTASCSGDKCYVWDVSSSLVTVVTLANVTGSSSPPYANSSDTTSPHNTGTAPGTGHVSGTTGGYSTQRANDTTTITSSTISIVIGTASGWSPWKPNSNASATGTGDRPLNSMNATSSGFRPDVPLSWSIWQPIPTRGPAGNSSMRLNSTFNPIGQTSTTHMPSPTGASCNSDATDCLTLTQTRPLSPSYVTTRTFIFADTTIVIPIPAGYASTLRPEATTKSLPTSTSTYETSGLISSSLSTSSCWTTAGPSISGSNTMTGSASTKICWLLECDDNNSCTDQISRYPITVDSDSTSMAAPSANATATMTTGPSNGTAFATATSSTEHQSMWAPWPTQKNGSTSDTIETPSPLTNPHADSSDTSIDGTITRTVIPLPGSTPEPSSHAKGAMVNRKHYVTGRSHFKAVQDEQEKRNA